MGDNYNMKTVDDQGNVARHEYVYQPYGVKKYIDATPQYNVTPYLNFYILNRSLVDLVFHSFQRLEFHIFHLLIKMEQ